MILATIIFYFLHGVICFVCGVLACITCDRSSHEDFDGLVVASAIGVGLLSLFFIVLFSLDYIGMTFFLFELAIIILGIAAGVYLNVKALIEEAKSEADNKRQYR